MTRFYVEITFEKVEESGAMNQNNEQRTNTGKGIYLITRTPETLTFQIDADNEEQARSNALNKFYTEKASKHEVDKVKLKIK